MSNPGQSVVAIAKHEPHEPVALAASHDLISGDRRTSEASADSAMHKLSRRLWTLEIHRRLEIQARQCL